MHAKLIVVDKQRALVGSMNIDRSAFDLRRELGITTDDPAVVTRLIEVFKSDWRISHHYEPRTRSIVPHPSRPTTFRTTRTWSMSEPGATLQKVSLPEIALSFNHIALASFGGGLSAWSREVVVVQKQWMSEEEFLSAMTMCRIVPGANQVNLAVFVGTKLKGMPAPSPH